MTGILMIHFLRLQLNVKFVFITAITTHIMSETEMKNITFMRSKPEQPDKMWKAFQCVCLTHSIDIHWQFIDHKGREYEMLRMCEVQNIW